MKKVKSPLTDGFLLADARSQSSRSLKSRFAKVVTRLLLVAILAFQCTGSFPFGPQVETSALAQSKSGSGGNVGSAPMLGPQSKLSPDLEDEISMSPNKKVSVIVQTPASPKRELSTAINQSSGDVRMAFQNVDALAVELPAAAVAALASRSDVKYLSLDKPTEVTGHLETTTGASLVRNYGNASTGTLNGTGVGIAILDSGVYSAHHSFGSRIVANVDFTGENRTDDRYGHGTHVAAIAGIDWCISNKATHNIRVLNLSFGAVARDSYVNDPLCLRSGGELQLARADEGLLYGLFGREALRQHHQA